jgi:hypothetical protein
LIINFPNYFVDNTYMLCIRVGFEMPNLITLWYIIKVDFCMQNLTPKIKIFILCVVLIIANNIEILTFCFQLRLVQQKVNTCTCFFNFGFVFPTFDTSNTSLQKLRQKMLFASESSFQTDGYA